MASKKRATWWKIHLHQKALLDCFPDAAVGEGLKAALCYFAGEEVGELSPAGNVVFQQFTPFIEECLEDYQIRVERGKEVYQKSIATPKGQGSTEDSSAPTKGQCPPEDSSALTRGQCPPEDSSALTKGQCYPVHTEEEVEAEVETEAEAEAEPEPETEKERERGCGGKLPRRFSPPSSEALQAYLLTLPNGHRVNPQQFLDFYTAKGWMVGKNKMKDWKAAARTWANRESSSHSGERASPSPGKWDGCNLGISW